MANNESAQWMAPVTFVSDLHWSDQFLFSLQILRSRMVNYATIRGVDAFHSRGPVASDQISGFPRGRDRLQMASATSGQSPYWCILCLLASF